MPETASEVLEISPQVVAVARRMFEVPAGDGRFTVRVCDGAEFIARDGSAYDAILVDGYDGDAQVETLSSRAFYAACRRRLDAGGVLVVNLWGSDRAFDDTLERIDSAFPAGTVCLPAERPGNVIVFAFRDATGNPRWDELDERARGLEVRYGLEFGKFVRSLRKMNRWDEERLYASDVK
jgi:spermidine synthase